jgi:hypothetical protein
VVSETTGSKIQLCDLAIKLVKLYSMNSVLGISPVSPSYRESLPCLDAER